MIPVSSLLVLDTNVLVHLIRNDAIGQRVEADYSLMERSERPLIVHGIGVWVLSVMG